MIPQRGRGTATHIRAKTCTHLTGCMTGATKRQRAPRGHTPHTITTERKKNGRGWWWWGFAHKVGVKCLSSIVIIFIQFRHFVRSRVTVGAVVSQPNEQRHSGSIHNDDTSEGV